jgi:hypothetical protein
MGLESLLDVVSSSPWTYAAVLGVAAFDALVPLVPSETAVIAAGVLAAAGDLQIASSSPPEPPARTWATAARTGSGEAWAAGSTAASSAVKGPRADGPGPSEPSTATAGR